MNRKNIEKIILSGALVASVVGMFTPAVSAQYAVEQPSTRTFLLDKKVLDPRSNKFEDNLSIEQFKFLPNQDVWYRIEFKNNKDHELTNIIGKDVLPASMQFVSGDGVYDPSTNTVTVTIDKIAPNSSRFWDIKARFVTGKGGQIAGTACVNNYAEARKDGEMMSDYANVCVTDKVLGEVSELPRTGPAATIALVGAMVTSFAGGLLLLKNNKK